MSAVAGILDKNGGVRVVITQRWRFHHHVKQGERIFIVPNLEVKEPVPWGQQAGLVNQVKAHIDKQLVEKDCRACGLCCKVPFIPELNKPSHVMCCNRMNDGCKIYNNRPDGCRRFECLWLKSLRTTKPMPAELRPDRCGVFLSSDTSDIHDPNLIEVHVDRDYPDALAPGKSIVEYLKDKKTKLITFYYGEHKT